MTAPKNEPIPAGRSFVPFTRRAGALLNLGQSHEVSHRWWRFAMTLRHAIVPGLFVAMTGCADNPTEGVPVASGPGGGIGIGTGGGGGGGGRAGATGKTGKGGANPKTAPTRHGAGRAA